MNAPDKASEIKVAIAAVFALLTSLWGWVGWATIVWLICVILDYISGSAAARANGEWSSKAAREGLWHKTGEIFAVLVAALCDIALVVVFKSSGVKLPFEIGPIVTPVVLLWYIITELGSVAENAGKLGAPVPSWLKKSLKQYKEKIDADHGEKPPDEGADFDVSGLDTKKNYEGQHVKDPYADVQRLLDEAEEERQRSREEVKTDIP